MFVPSDSQISNFLIDPTDSMIITTWCKFMIQKFIDHNKTPNSEKAFMSLYFANVVPCNFKVPNWLTDDTAIKRCFSSEFTKTLNHRSVHGVVTLTRMIYFVEFHNTNESCSVEDFKRVFDIVGGGVTEPKKRRNRSI